MAQDVLSQGKNEYLRWLNYGNLDQSLRNELLDISDDEQQIADRFYRSLAFGTGGLRGVIGAGTNRMNICTVAKATQGLAGYLSRLPGGHKSVVIAYDSRVNGRLFAETAAQVLAGNGITAYVFPRLAPTPLLSFAVRELHCAAGICVTASHNPAKYNGYKVYGADGCQITLDAAAAIQAEIDLVDVLDGAKMMPLVEARRIGLTLDVPEEVFDRFIDRVAAQAMPVEDAENIPLHVVYTPLNGAGRECVLRILERIGIDRVTVVPSQEQPDGNFPTCPYPNPEERASLTEGLKLCDQVRPDLLLATDPDCDRVSVAVAENGSYRLLTGNEMGVLLFDYICSCRLSHNMMPADPVAITTIVSTDMANAVAAHYGVELHRTLTGFKFIGEQIGLLEEAGQAERFIFGFEESCGYLSGIHVRDKDAVNASMLTCQMARHYKAMGLTLGRAMDRLYEQYGYYNERLLSFSFQGGSGMAGIEELMCTLRKKPLSSLAGNPVIRTRDYLEGQDELPSADVLSFETEHGDKVIIRPSGTEPKLKMYLFIKAETREQAQNRIQTIAIQMEQMVSITRGKHNLQGREWV